MILLIVTGSVSVFMDSMGMTIALPKMEIEFKVDKSTIQWVQTIYLLAQAILTIPLSKLGIMFGEMNMMILCNTITVVAQIGLCFVSNFWVFCVIKFVVGGAHCCLVTIRTSMLRKMAKPNQSRQFI